ncbi:MAG TPA: recombinase family protein [Clostridia bacterium]|nr:recombinase family protein [Clostridia bacterium]
MNTIKSEQTKQGLRKSFQSGASKKAQTVCYGYVRQQDGTLIICSKQADVVRSIFELYLTGYSLGRIVEELELQGVASPTGKARWNSQTIDKMLSNEKYIGNVVLQKTVTESGIQIKNRDIGSLIEIQDTHPAIIPKELFQAVQEEKARRTPGVSKHNSTNMLSGLLVCAECGSSYRRLTRRHGEIVWRCANRVEHGDRVCKTSPTVAECKVIEHLEASLGCLDELLVRKRIDRISVKADGSLQTIFGKRTRNLIVSRER